MSIGSPLHFSAGKIGCIGWIGRHPDAVYINLVFAEKKHDSGTVVEGTFSAFLSSLKGGPTGQGEGGVGRYIVDAEMKSEWLHLGVLLERRASPCRDVGIAGAVDDNSWIHPHQPVFVCDSDRFYAAVPSGCIASEAIE